MFRVVYLVKKKAGTLDVRVEEAGAIHYAQVHRIIVRYIGTRHLC